MKTKQNLEGQINYYRLKAGVSQQTLRRLDNNYQSFFVAIKDYKLNPTRYKGTPRPPKYIKDSRYNLIFDSQRFTRTFTWLWLEKEVKLKIPKNIRNTQIVQVEIIPRLGFFEMIFTYEDDTFYRPIPLSAKTMAIDLGLDNLATCTSDCDMKPFAIDGRKLKAINQLYNKVRAKYQSLLQRISKKKCSKKLQRIDYKREKRVRDYLHKAAHKIADLVWQYKISIVVIGLLTGALDKVNLGKKTNQNFVYLSLGQFVNILKYKLELHGVTVITKDEDYTSKSSFLDNDPIPKRSDEIIPVFSGKRIHRGLYRCKDGTLINADVNGSYNILRLGKPEFCSDFIRQKDGVAGWLHPVRLSIE
jgi:putative transposase